MSIFRWFKEGRGNLVVRARAGTGKTTTIIEGIRSAPEDRILLAAFNKRIATELQTRLKNPSADAKTLHSVGFRNVLGNWSGCKLDDERGKRMARAACGVQAPDPIVNMTARLASFAKSAAPFATIKEMVDIAWDKDCVPSDYQEEDGWTVERLSQCALTAMELACQRENVPSVDFDDMVFVPVRNGWVRGYYDLVVIDECQDMSAVQIELALRSTKSTGRIAVVGDDRQAIYGFRGADSGSLDRLKTALKADEMGLTITYRCPKVVVAEAQRFVPDFIAAPTAPDGIMDSMALTHLATSAKPGDFVLSRKNAPLIKICLEILRTGTRATVAGRDIGKGLIGVVKRINAKSMVDFDEKVTLWRDREVNRAMKADKPAKVDEAYDKAETLFALAEGLSSVYEVIARIESLFSDEGGAKVVCSSVHKAKGLEADRVFLLKWTFRPTGPAEEQNIQYVAITRSKSHLTWVDGQD